ncbi:MAG: hypothetical protein HQL70_04095 [Magnetococcales bacterium]|nr:hypothetical protein [Magnetococcales bacterium]
MAILKKALDMRIALFFLLAMLMMQNGLAAVEPEQDIQRFFTTKKQRVSLDFARRKALRKKRINALKDGKDRPNVQQTITLNGYVIRTRGPSAVWMNGNSAIMEDADIPDGVEFTTIGKVKGVAVELTKSQGNKKVLLKTGQRMDGQSGAILEPYQGVFETLMDEDAKAGGSAAKDKKKSGSKKRAAKKKAVKKRKTKAGVSSDEAVLNEMISKRESFTKKIDFMNKLMGQ